MRQEISFRIGCFDFSLCFSPVPFYPAGDCKVRPGREGEGRGGEGSNATRGYDTGVMARSASFQSLSPFGGRIASNRTPASVAIARSLAA
jgi:hypothetical protein